MPRLLVAGWLLLLLVLGSLARAQEGPAPDAEQQAGLASFIEARIHESSGRYREALRAYESALEEAPSVTEIRVQYAALLVELGLAGRAVEVLEDVDEMDWFGLRVRALALARHSARNEQYLDEAEDALRAALDEREDDPNLQLSLGQVLHRLGRVEEAEAVIAQLRTTRGGSPQLVAYHASLLKALGRLQEAAELFAECAASDLFGGADCRDNLVQLLVELGRPGEAGEVMLRWLQDDDLDELLRAATLLYEGGRNDQALRTVQRVLRQVPDSARARALRAYLLSSGGRYREAAAEFRDLVRSDRGNIDLMLALAWATANADDHDEARRWVDRAWELVQEDSGSARAGRVAMAAARVEMVGGHTALARGWLDRVADYQAAGEEFVFLLAQTYRSDGQWSEGIAALLRLQPELEGRARSAAVAFETEFRLRLGDSRATRLLRQLIDFGTLDDVLLALQVLQTVERWEDVEREAAVALQRLPDARDIRFTRAAALERLGRVDEAEPLFRALIEQNPNDAAAANYLGYTLADRGRDLEDALQLISRAVALEPENPAYLDSLGWVHFRLGDLEQAEYWLRRAVGLGGGDGTILAHLGEVMLQQGEVGEARSLLRNALDLGCEHPEYVRELLAGLADGD